MGNSRFSDLVELIAQLRDPEGGCPWDRAQDHRSLRPYLLEEAHEAIAAIDADDPRALVAELGDVLLQVVLHSQIAAERGEFGIDDVMAALADKLTRRHPHVFGDASSDLPSIHQRWEEIKADERQAKTELPLLLRARKLAAVRAHHGQEEACERAPETAEELAGCRILDAIAAAWRDGIDPELSLRKVVERLEAEATP